MSTTSNILSSDLNNKVSEFLDLLWKMNPTEYAAVEAKYVAFRESLNAALRNTVEVEVKVAAETKKRLRKHRCSAKPCSHRSSCKCRCRQVGTVDDGFMIDKEDMWYCGDCYSNLKDRYRGASQPDDNEESLNADEESDDGLSVLSDSEGEDE